MRKLIDSGTATEKLAAYSRAVSESGWIFVSGTMGIDPATGAMPADVSAQMEVAFTTIESALKEVGAELADVVRCRVFLRSRDDLPAMAASLKRKFATIRPANTTIICELPIPEARVEIEVTACRVPVPKG